MHRPRGSYGFHRSTGCHVPRFPGDDREARHYHCPGLLRSFGTESEEIHWGLMADPVGSRGSTHRLRIARKGLEGARGGRAKTRTAILLIANSNWCSLGDYEGVRERVRERGWRARVEILRNCPWQTFSNAKTHHEPSATQSHSRDPQVRRSVYMNMAISTPFVYDWGDI